MSLVDTAIGAVKNSDTRLLRYRTKEAANPMGKKTLQSRSAASSTAIGQPGRGNKQFGDRGEQLAADWLVRHGYRLIARNWRSPLGELDIIGEQGEELVFVEVKARHGARLGAPEEAVTLAKRRRLIRAAESYLLAHHQEQRPYRIDVIAIDVSSSGELLDIRHYPGCIEAEGY
jgi:putative endonuclease